MNYDRRHIESVKKKQQVSSLPFLKLFIVLAALIFILLALVQ